MNILQTAEIIRLVEENEKLQKRITELEAEAELGNIPYKEAVALQKRVRELEGKLQKISDSKDWDDSKLAAETMALNKRTERRHGTKLSAEECECFADKRKALTWKE